MEVSSVLLDIGVWNLLGLMGIMVIGLPHGALDGAVAMHLGLVEKFSKMAKFLLMYVALATLVVGIWLITPTVSLIAFLIISMLHFGSGDARNGKNWLFFAETIAHGGLVIIGISQFHRGEVDQIFAYLTNQSTAMVWLAIDMLTAVVILAILTCLVQTTRDPRWGKTSLELLVLGVIYWLFPPLLGFAIYFCLVHSARHFKSIFATIKQTISLAKIKNQAIIFTTISWAAIAIAFWLLADFSNPEPVIMRITFIGLAALTVPHMILIDGVMKLQQSKTSSAVLG